MSVMNLKNLNPFESIKHFFFKNDEPSSSEKKNTDQELHPDANKKSIDDELHPEISKIVVQANETIQKRIVKNAERKEQERLDKIREEEEILQNIEMYEDLAKLWIERDFASHFSEACIDKHRIRYNAPFVLVDDVRVPMKFAIDELRKMNGVIVEQTYSSDSYNEYLVYPSDKVLSLIDKVNK